MKILTNKHAVWNNSKNIDFTGCSELTTLLILNLFVCLHFVPISFRLFESSCSNSNMWYLSFPARCLITISSVLQSVFYQLRFPQFIFCHCEATCYPQKFNMDTSKYRKIQILCVSKIYSKYWYFLIGFKINQMWMST